MAERHGTSSSSDWGHAGWGRSVRDRQARVRDGGHRPVLGSGTVTRAGVGAPNTVATTSLTAWTPASIVPVPAGGSALTPPPARAAGAGEPPGLGHPGLP